MSEQPAPYIVAGEDVAVRSHLLVSPADAAALARCEYTAVMGRDGWVDVRMPRAAWERLRDVVRGERR